MNNLLVILISEIVRQAPALAIELVRLFSKPAVSDADWAEVRTKFSTGYNQYIADAQSQAQAAAKLQVQGKN